MKDFSAPALEWRGEFTETLVYAPERRPGFVAWASAFAYGDGSVGLSFDEVLEEENPDFMPMRLEYAEAAGVPVRRAGEREAAARWMMAFDASTTLRLAGEREAEGLDFTLYGVGSATGLTAQLERGNLAALAAWSDYAAGYLAVQRAVEAARGEEGELTPLPFSILRREDIYAPENQKLLFPIMSSSSR